MIEIPTQIRSECPVCNTGFGLYFLPYGDQASDKAKEYKQFQILKSRFWGIKKPRSVKQLNQYWACCGLLAELLSDHENIMSKGDVDFRIKTTVTKENPSMIKRFQVVGGVTYIEPISISFANMKHLEACKYFEKAFKTMADWVGVEKDKLILMSQEKMGRVR